MLVDSPSQGGRWGMEREGCLPSLIDSGNSPWGRRDYLKRREGWFAERWGTANANMRKKQAVLLGEQRPPCRKQDEV